MTNQHRLHSQTPQPDRGRAQTHVHRAHTKPYQEKARLLVSIRSLQLSTSLLVRHFALPLQHRAERMKTHIMSDPSIASDRDPVADGLVLPMGERWGEKNRSRWVSVEYTRSTCDHSYNIMTKQHRPHPQTPQPSRGRAQPRAHSAHTNPSYQERMRLLVAIRSLQLSTSLLARHFALPLQHRAEPMKTHIMSDPSIASERDRLSIALLPMGER